MSQFAPLSGRAVRRVTGPALQSTALFHWAARSQSLTAYTGQQGALVRASSDYTEDSNGVGISSGYARPRWFGSSWLGTPAAFLYCHTADNMTWPITFPLQTMTILLEWVNLATTQTSGAGLFALGKDDSTGARVYAQQFPTNKLAAYDSNGSTGGGSDYATTISANDRVQSLVQFEVTGGNQRVRLGCALNGGAFSFASFGSSNAVGTFGTSPVLRLNRVGSAGTAGQALFRRVAIFPGLLTLDQATARL